MLKNKASLALAGVMTLLGVVVGTAFIASAQGTTSTTAIAPTTVTSSSSSDTAVDTPESANDPADTAKDSEVDKPDSANDESDAANIQSLPAGAITSDQAVKIAEAKVGGTATHVAIDDDKVNGHAAYEVKTNGKEVKIDALTGAIVETNAADDQN